MRIIPPKTASKTMEEKRKYTRIFLLYHLRVFNNYTNELIGFLADITPRGMMLIGGIPYKTRIIFNVRMILPKQMYKKNEIVFEAKSIWCKKYLKTRYWGIGFILRNVLPEYLDIINSLSQKLNVNNIFGDEAVKFYKGLEQYNCAQAVLKSFEEHHEVTQRSIRKYSSYGSGEARGGVCGALFAARSLIKNRKHKKEFTRRFQEEVGTILCAEIMQFGYLSCAGCIYIAHKIVQEMINRGAKTTSILDPHPSKKKLEALIGNLKQPKTTNHTERKNSKLSVIKR